MTTDPPLMGGNLSVEPDYPVVEIPTPSLDAEARTAMALVAGLIDAGVHRRKIAIVTRELDDYEQALRRAAIRYEIPPVFWTQIRLTDTRLYTLLQTVCELLDTESIHPHALSRTLALGWTRPDPDADDADWPVAPSDALDAFIDGPDDALSLPEWDAIVSQPRWPDPRVATFVSWLVEHADTTPAPATIDDLLGGIVERYREVVLPTIKASDSPALLETETAARAVVRLRALVRQVVAKIADQRVAIQRDPSWDQVAGLLKTVATQHPGRREHANAYAVDMLEANDIWQRDIPYVIALGLIESRWPQEPASVLAAALQHALLAGTGTAAQIVPRTHWVAGRDYDQFAETVQTARDALVVTRYVTAHDGTDCARSALLNALEPTLIDPSARQRLVSTDTELPAPIHATVSPTSKPGTMEVTNE